MGILKYLWLIPVLPLAAAAVTAVLPRRQRAASALLTITSMAISLGLSSLAFLLVWRSGAPEGFRFDFSWFQVGETSVRLGWILDPLSAVMLVMVSLISLLIFIYSLGYMAHDPNFTRFFCFLSLFGAAMLGLVISNSLLLLFVCWELVGLASYLLIGFWFQKPSAAAAAKKAFITTRIGDLAFLIGMIWLHCQTGTTLFYDGGKGCLEAEALGTLAVSAFGPISAATAIGLLLFAGAVGKSGQVPLHVWLPDAMEGPTPVSALIHAATMVAAGVFLIARVYPLMAVQAPAMGALLPGESVAVLVQTADAAASVSPALKVVTWIGVFTALFAAGIAIAQNDIKRILAYSTVSQLGFMMVGLGVGGVAVGMFHLVAHAFFKALLFLGAGSVIHGLHEEQDIRRMGGLRKWMPVTFGVYAIGMLALSGFPLLFSGFWSKDAILHAAHEWPASHGPFYLALLAAFLTAFYMTRQMVYVFFGKPFTASQEGLATGYSDAAHLVHESPRIMLVPMMVLACFAVALGFIGTPAWPWFQTFLEGTRPGFSPGNLLEHGVLLAMVGSSVVALAGLALGWFVYSRQKPGATEALERRWPATYQLLARRFFVDEIYEGSVIRVARWFARAADWFDRTIVAGLVRAASGLGLAASWLSRATDEFLVDRGFDRSCSELNRSGGFFSSWQNGLIQSSLKVVAAGLILLILFLSWGARNS